MIIGRTQAAAVAGVHLEEMAVNSEQVASPRLSELLSANPIYYLPIGSTIC